MSWLFGKRRGIQSGPAKLYRFAPRRDITIDELAGIVAGQMQNLRYTAEEITGSDLRRHFEVCPGETSVSARTSAPR